MDPRFKNSPQNSRPCGFQVLGPTWMANLGALWPCWALIFWGHPATPNAKACREQLEPRTSIRSELPRNLKSTVKGFCPLSKYSQPNSLWDHACLISYAVRGETTPKRSPYLAQIKRNANPLPPKIPNMTSCVARRGGIWGPLRQ